MRGWRAEAIVAAAAGMVAIVVAAPFIADLARASLVDASPVELSVRGFGPVDRSLDAFGAGIRRRQVYRLAALPVNYLLEFGFVALAAGWYWLWRVRARRPLSRGELGVAVLALAALLVASFLKSAIRSNDLGWRSAMFLQFALLLWATDVIPVLRRRRAPADGARVLGSRARAALAAVLMVGVATVVYEVGAMRLYMVGRLIGSRYFGEREWPIDANGRRLHDLRSAYTWVDRTLPRSAVVQPNPAYRGGNPYPDRRTDVVQGLYGRRAVVAGDPEYGTLYGIPQAMYDSVARPIVAAFASRAPDGAAAVCRRYAISALLVKDADPAWRDRASWVWQARPAYANGTTRVISCSVLVR